MNFIKMEATGNDFIVIDARDKERDWSCLAQAMCDRHLGVGADGLLLLLPSEIADFQMRIFNADGSEAEACGNGLRCLVKYIIEHILTNVNRQELMIETAAGITKAHPYIVDGQISFVQVAMGIPRWTTGDIPMSLTEGIETKFDITSIASYNMEVSSRELQLTLVSMGNPHAVCFLNDPVEEFPLAQIGPVVENYPIFPERTNFEIVNVLSRKRMKARVWERGVGETLSCGSGACAIAVAAQLHDYVDSQVDITLPGGVLTIEWDRAGEVQLAGPVREIFSGEWF